MEGTSKFKAQVATEALKEREILTEPVSNEKCIRRLMRKMCLEPIYPKRNLSRLGVARYIHPYLLRDVELTRQNRVRAIDITYILI